MPPSHPSARHADRRLLTMNAALEVTNLGTRTGKTPFASMNAALDITNDLPRIQSPRPSCSRMPAFDTTSAAFVVTTEMPCPQSSGEAPTVVEVDNSQQVPRNHIDAELSSGEGVRVRLPRLPLSASSSQLPASSFPASCFLLPASCFELPALRLSVPCTLYPVPFLL